VYRFAVQTVSPRAYARERESLNLAELKHCQSVLTDRLTDCLTVTDWFSCCDRTATLPTVVHRLARAGKQSELLAGFLFGLQDDSVRLATRNPANLVMDSRYPAEHFHFRPGDAGLVSCAECAHPGEWLWPD
jgi:hypothetical protein